MDSDLRIHAVGGEFMDINVRKFEEKDIESMISIWNEVVEEGVAYPQLDLLDEKTGAEFFCCQTYCGVAEDAGTGEIRDCIFCIRTMWADAAIYPTPVMR